LVSVVSTVEILHLLNSATRLVWIMYPALRSVFRSLDWLLLRLHSDNRDLKAIA